MSFKCISCSFYDDEEVMCSKFKDPKDQLHGFVKLQKVTECAYWKRKDQGDGVLVVGED